MASCADESTALQYPSFDGKDRTVAEGFAGVALHRVEMTSQGKKKEETFFAAAGINACWYVFSFL